MQEYLLSDDAQEKIRQTGRRTGLTEDYSQYGEIFNSEWGIDTEKILSPITMPSEETLMKALNLYQTAFRKSSLNIYCLDFSGSMRGEGNRQLTKAMAQILLPENAEKKLLQASENEVNIVVTFDGDVRNFYTVEAVENLPLLYEDIAAEEDGGQVGDLLSSLVVKVNSLDPSSLTNDNGILSKLPVVKNAVKSLKKLAERYSKAEVQIDKIEAALEKSRMDMLKDISVFDIMYKQNLDCFRELGLYIQAGKERVEEIKRKLSQS